MIKFYYLLINFVSFILEIKNSLFIIYVSNEDNSRKHLKMLDSLEKITNIKRSYSDDVKQLWKSKNNNQLEIKELKRKYQNLQGTY